MQRRGEQRLSGVESYALDPVGLALELCVAQSMGVSEYPHILLLAREGTSRQARVYEKVLQDSPL